MKTSEEWQYEPLGRGEGRLTVGASQPPVSMPSILRAARRSGRLPRKANGTRAQRPTSLLPSPRALGGHATGFSLVEVLVALAILALSFSTLIVTQNSHMALSYRAAYMNKAVLLAREKLAELEVFYRNNALPIDDQAPELHKIEEKPFGDEFPEFGYQVTIRKVKIPLPTNILEGQEGAEVDAAISNSASYISEIISRGVRELKLEVFWVSETGEDHVEFVTHLVDINANIGVRTQ